MPNKFGVYSYIHSWINNNCITIVSCKMCNNHKQNLLNIVQRVMHSIVMMSHPAEGGNTRCNIINNHHKRDIEQYHNLH